MANDSSKGRTGIFYVKDPAGVVVMKDGEEIYRYKNVQEFVEAHAKGMAALEREMESEIEKAYRPE
jgi:hypothetical protein